MSFVVTLRDFRPGARYDGLPWTQARIEESATVDGTYTAIDTQALSPLDTDPIHPAARNLTTDNATLAQGYYRVAFLDASGAEQVSEPVFFPGTEEGYCTPADVREALAPTGDTSSATAAKLTDAQLNDAITEATSEVDAKISGAPYADSVPPIITSITRDVAAYLATLTFRKSNPLADDHPVRLRYARAEEILNAAASGKLELPDTPSGVVDSEVAVANLYEGQLFGLADLGIGPSESLPPQNG